MRRRTLEDIWRTKGKITSQLVFTLPRREGKFRVETDVSEHTIVEVLSQEQEGK